ncbi:hypothetical protein [Desulfonatronum sp. SC1]|uniref:hypothetical protein n=1 Tax=Desulfonatronum sp. SC1 TaxID=2109626 RepID=UPI000D303EEA|nr:hypothetical protein [Desulfonatronum sp. SC1]PTN35969.1 hypothetical protein C6366_10495 [Desulfonatronum sp. SC1]
MSKGLNVILMHDDGWTWRCRVRTAWLRIGLYAILALFLTSGTGLFGSFFFWNKLTRISSENHVMQSKISDMQPRLDRLLMFEQIFLDYDQHQARDTLRLPTPARINDVGMDIGLLSALLPPVSDGFSSSIPTSELKYVASDIESAESRELRDTVADSFLNQNPAHSVAKPIAAGDISSPDHELAEGHEPDGTVEASSPEPKMPDGPATHLAEADNVQLSLGDDNMELRFDLHNRSGTTIAGRIVVSFIARNDQVVQAEGGQRALRFRIQFFREVHSPLLLPAGYSIGEMSAMRIEIVSRIGDILYSQTYPLANLLPGTG